LLDLLDVLVVHAHLQPKLSAPSSAYLASYRTLSRVTQRSQSSGHSIEDVNRLAHGPNLERDAEA
jgi:hypothetical protein